MLRVFLLVYAAVCVFAQGTGVISGIVVDSHGNPVAETEVSLLIRTVEPDPQAKPPTMNTEADGVFRFTRLVPGTYTVRAQHQRYKFNLLEEISLQLDLRPGEELTGLRLRAVLFSVIEGTITDTNGDPVESAKVEVLQYLNLTAFQQRELVANGSHATDDRGRFRITNLPPGPAYIRVHYQGGSGPNRTGLSTPPTYFPGTTDRRRATRLDIQPGIEYRAINMAIRREPGFSIRGTLRDNTGVFRTSGVTVQVAREEGADLANLGGAIANGRFEIRDLPSGDYVLSVGTGLSFTFGNDDRPSPYGQVRVSLVNRDVEGIEIRVTSPPTVSGTMKLADGTPVAARVTLYRQGMPISELPLPYRRTFISDLDGAFGNSTAVSAGHYFLDVAATDPPAFIQSVNGNPPGLLSVEAGIRHEFHIVLSAKVASVEGTLNAPGIVALWPADPAVWNPHAVRTTHSDAKGIFAVDNLAPGKYRVAAFDPTHPDIGAIIFDQAFLHEFKASSVELGEDTRAAIAMELFSKESVSNAMEKLR